MPSDYANLLLVSADTLARKPNMYSSSSSDDSSSNGTGSSSNDCLRDFLFPDPPPFPPPTLMPLTTPPLPLSPLIGEVPTAEGCCYASAAVYHTQVNLIEDSMNRFISLYWQALYYSNCAARSREKFYGIFSFAGVSWNFANIKNPKAILRGCVDICWLAG